MIMTNIQLLIALCTLLGMVVIAATTLRGWQGWLALKNRELDIARSPSDLDGGAHEGAARIELADLKERIRKLEAIANGVDL